LSNFEPPVHCLAVRVYRLAKGEIDTNELVALLDATAGLHQWLMTEQWLFRSPPIETRPGIITIPVVCPEAAAHRLQSLERTGRVKNVGVVSGPELRQWRWVAFQVQPNAEGRGNFPWEIGVQGGFRLHG